MLENLSDMFFLSDDKFLSLSKDLSIAEIYHEAVHNHKIVTVEDAKLVDKWLVKLVKTIDIKNRHVSECLVSPFMDDSIKELSLRVPVTLNKTNLLASLYRSAVNIGRKLSFSISGDTVHAQCKATIVDTGPLSKLKPGESVTIHCPTLSDVNRVRYLVRCQGYELSTRMSTRLEGRDLVVTWPTDDKVSQVRPRFLSKRCMFDNWIDPQEWDTWLEIPEQFLSELHYYKQMASTHFTRSVKVKGTQFMKASTCLSKDKKQVVVRHLGQIIYRCDTNSVRNISASDIAGINVLLINIGKTYEDLL